MSKPSESTPSTPHVPTRRERLRPLELLIFSAVLAVFAGLVVLLTTRSPLLAVIFFGIAFIVSVLGVALLGLGGEPSAEDLEARKDLQDPVVGAAGRRAREAAAAAAADRAEADPADTAADPEGTAGAGAADASTADADAADDDDDQEADAGR